MRTRRQMALSVTKNGPTPPWMSELLERQTRRTSDALALAEWQKPLGQVAWAEDTGEEIVIWRLGSVGDAVFGMDAEGVVMQYDPGSNSWSVAGRGLGWLDYQSTDDVQALIDEANAIEVTARSSLPT